MPVFSIPGIQSPITIPGKRSPRSAISARVKIRAAPLDTE